MPFLDNLEISWILNGIVRSKRSIGRVYQNQLIKQSFVVSKAEFGNLKAQISHGEDKNPIEFSQKDFIKEEQGESLFKSHAMQEFIRLQFTESLAEKKERIQLALKYGIFTTDTAFYGNKRIRQPQEAVNQQEEAKAVNQVNNNLKFKPRPNLQKNP